MGRRAGYGVAAGALALCATVMATVALAGSVTSTTEIETYAMEGTTPLAIVSYYHTRPFSGDHGPALANIRYTTDLNVDTKESGDRCRASSVRLSMHFVVTLPDNDETAAMSRSTRAMWNQLVAFARAHEFGHRAMDLQCMRRFVERAERVSGESCRSVESTVRDMLEASEAACDRGQRGYDQRESVRAANLGMFRAARLAQ